MDCPFVVGQKVVCITKEPWRSAVTNEVRPNGPIYGKIYQSDIDLHDGKAYLRLLEFPATRSFLWDRFRPLQDRKTDISVFTQILDRANRRREQKQQKDLVHDMTIVRPAPDSVSAAQGLPR